MFGHKFIGKPVGNCGINRVDWKIGLSRNEIVKVTDTIIFTEFHLMDFIGKGLIYIPTLNLYSAAGKIYSFNYMINFKSKEQAIEYFKYF
jgi:hypothetical protein